MTVLELAQGYFDHSVTLDMSLVELLSDSLDEADFILEAENALGVDVPDDDLAHFVTLQDLQNYVDSRSLRN